MLRLPAFSARFSTPRGSEAARGQEAVNCRSFPGFRYAAPKTQLRGSHLIMPRGPAGSLTTGFIPVDTAVFCRHKLHIYPPYPLPAGWPSKAVEIPRAGDSAYRFTDLRFSLL